MTSILNGHDLVTGLRLVSSDREYGRGGQHHAVRGEYTKLPRAHSPWSSLVRQGIVGQFAAIIATFIIATQVGLTPLVGVATTIVVATWSAINLATLPAYERANSLAPAKRLALLVAGGTFAVTVAGEMPNPLFRDLVIVFAAAAGMLGFSAIVHRRIMRRVPTLLVGPADAVNRLHVRWEHRKDVDVVGACTWDPEAPMVSATVNSVTRDVPRMLHTARASRVVIVADDAMANPTMRHLAWGLRRAEIECLILADMHDYVEYVRPVKVGEQLALALDQPNSHLVSRTIKAISDRILALFALVLVSPLMAAIAVAIRLDSSGPVFFRQERTGKDGVPFTMVKFRSMVNGADDQVDDLRELNEGAGPLFKMTDDPRVTRVGRFLRRSSLDELPQLFNVLTGSMSLVGPRPAIESETSQYSQWVWRRLHVKPGITGLWQVSGRSDLSWDESIRLDLKYVNNWNLRMDARILLRTIGVVLNRKGAW